MAEAESEKPSRIILATGSRGWRYRPIVYKALSQFSSQSVLIHGMCRGLDIMADSVARSLGMRVIREPAHWSHEDKAYTQVFGPCPPDCKEVCGRPAGVLRNDRMLVKHPNINQVLAFHENISESTGTMDMILKSMEREIPIILYDTRGKVLERTTY